MRLKHRVVALSAVVACAAFSSHVDATDSKVMPGSACQPVQSALATDITRRGSLFNSQGEEIGIDCPIVRDNRAENAGPVTAQVRVKGGGQRVSCDLSSYDRNGAIVDFGQRRNDRLRPCDPVAGNCPDCVSRGLQPHLFAPRRGGTEA